MLIESAILDHLAGACYSYLFGKEVYNYVLWNSYLSKLTSRQQSNARSASPIKVRGRMVKPRVAIYSPGGTASLPTCCDPLMRKWPLYASCLPENKLIT